MSRPRTLKEMEEDTLQRRCKELGVVALYLHGSHASGTARPDSDKDFAYLLSYDLESEPVEDALIPMLAALCGCDESEIDLQNLRQAPPHFRVRVIELGRLVSVSDTTELARFHACSVSEDRDLERYLAPFRQAMRERIREGRYAS